MKESSRYIIAAGIFISCLSSFYFMSLFFHLPFFVPVALCVVSLYPLYKWVVADKTRVQPATSSSKMEWLSLVAVMAALAILSYHAVAASAKYGGWDASAIWNYHAEFLTYPNEWKKLFQDVLGHSDYPLCLPATIAFFMRVLSADTVVIPFVISVAFSLAIPLLVWREVAGRNTVVAIATLIVFVSEHYYIEAGVSQYADILVAFFFLCAFICAAYMQANKKYLVLCAFFLAACAWTKNEGAVLAVIFAGYYGSTFFSKKNIRFTAMGIAIPVVSLLILKFFCGVHNDLVSKTGSGVFGLLVQKERYTMIFSSYVGLAYTKFLCTAIAICVYAFIYIIIKKAPGRNTYILLTCLFAYSMIYVVTPLPLQWHLDTSQSRLLLQLMPALVYVMGSGLADITFALPKWVKMGKV